MIDRELNNTHNAELKDGVRKAIRKKWENNFKNKNKIAKKKKSQQTRQKKNKQN